MSSPLDPSLFDVLEVAGFGSLLKSRREVALQALHHVSALR